MKWLVKAAMQQVLSRLPDGGDWNYTLQRSLTRSLPVSDRLLTDKVYEASLHLQAARARLGHDQPCFHEIGAGWDLIVPLALWSLGVERQVLVDIVRLSRFELVNDTLARLHRMRPQLEAKLGRSLRDVDPRPVQSWQQLAERFGISYLAPADARAMPLADAACDYTTSLLTLEHIPASDLVPILAECRRVVGPRGGMRAVIDMRDHYSYFDPTLSVYHYLRYEDRLWDWLNPPLHYQNRLRYPDYVAAFRTAGWRLVAEDIEYPTDRDLATLRAMPLARRYRRLPLRALGIRRAAVIAEPA